jgi:hypothetical protein
MALPVTIPNEFANATTSIPLSQLDTNFTTLADAVNGISDGSETLANASVTVLTAGTANVTTLNTSGQVVFNDAGADVDFRVEGDTDANLLFVDASAESIGVGTSSPNLTSFQRTVTLGDGTGSTVRHAYEINGGQSSADSSIGDFNVYNKGTLVSRMLTVRGSADNSGVLTFYTSNAGTSAERMRITSAGAVEIANGNLVFSTNGTGIDFSASAGGGASSSLLDDYEEGTWTPTLGGNTTYTTQAGKYTKIGNFVYVTGIITVNTFGTGSATLISGLPFTAGGTSGRTYPGSVAYFQNIATNVTAFFIRCGPGDANMFVASTTGNTGTAPTNNIFGDSTRLDFALGYFV